MDAAAQRARILDQFTRQAIPFTEIPSHSQDDTNRLVIETAGIGPTDEVLDVACGPGLITCEMARAARHVTGIDLTPAMIEQARLRQERLGLANMGWRTGDASEPLPFADGSFSVVATRYSFHHFLEPAKAFAEMVRVCRPGGTVCVTDVFVSSPEQGAAYDELETLRDPSHVRGLSLGELTGLFDSAGLTELRTAFYKVEMEVETILAASFPNPGDADKVRRLFEADLDTNRLGLGATRRAGKIVYAYPIAVVAGRKP